MLAHFAYSRRPASPRIALVTALVATALAALPAFLGSTTALGADTLPLGNIDVRSTGKVSNSDVAPRGSMVTGVSIEAAQGVVSEKALTTGDATDVDLRDATVLRDANRATVFLGASITSRLEVTLGLNGSYEHVKPAERDALFPAATTAEADLSWRGSVKQTGFAGASLFLKLKLVDWSAFRLAFAPFIESGAGEQATYSLTRSVGPKAGFMTIATYGAEGVADLSINAGMRYRDPEVVGNVTLRNEQFAKAAVRAYITRNFAFFVAGEGRRLMVADTQEIDIESGKHTYEPRESGDVKGGLQVRLGESELTAFGGGMPGNAGGFGFGKTTYGLTVAMPLGNYRGERGGRSIGAEIEKEEEKKALAKQEQLPPKPAAPVDDYPEMIGADIDPLDALGKDDAPDFKDVNSRQKQYELDATVESEDAKVERELKELKAADAKAAEERSAIQKVEQAKARTERVKRAKEDKELMNEWMEEAQKDADSAPTIEADEAAWNGLE